METHEYLISTVSRLADVLDRIPAAADHDPTPCTDFDVARLRGHVVGWLSAFTAGFEDPDGRCSDPADTAVDGNAAAHVRKLSGRLEQALPDAAERPLFIGTDAMPGPMALSMILWEYQVHGWDLARATNQDWQPETGGLEESLAFAPSMLTPEFQGEGKTFGPRIDVGTEAPALHRLLGLSGRHPGWPAAAVSGTVG
jgi:uncharacterized protein (TIGR03086 family)